MDPAGRLVWAGRVTSVATEVTGSGAGRSGGGELTCTPEGLEEVCEVAVDALGPVLPAGSHGFGVDATDPVSFQHHHAVGQGLSLVREERFVSVEGPVLDQAAGRTDAQVLVGAGVVLIGMDALQELVVAQVAEGGETGGHGGSSEG